MPPAMGAMGGEDRLMGVVGSVVLVEVLHTNISQTER
jgi:hypothetical protein